MYALMEIIVILSVNLFEDALGKSVRSLAFNERLNTNKWVQVWTSKRERRFKVNLTKSYVYFTEHWLVKPREKMTDRTTAPDVEEEAGNFEM